MRAFLAASAVAACFYIILRLLLCEGCTWIQKIFAPDFIAFAVLSPVLALPGAGGQMEPLVLARADTLCNHLLGTYQRLLLFLVLHLPLRLQLICIYVIALGSCIHPLRCRLTLSLLESGTIHCVEATHPSMAVVCLRLQLRRAVVILLNDHFFHLLLLMRTVIDLVASSER